MNLFCVSMLAQNNDNFQIAAFPDSTVILYNEKPTGPDWMNTATFYEIYPQSFFDTNGDGIGDLKGIIKKLDYIKSLGVDAIWLNPFYKSPFRDAGYDVSDYYKVASRYGTNKDAKNLFLLAKQKGLRVIIDFVPGHTSIDHPWFKASCRPLKNKYSNWYIWTDSTWFSGDQKYKENFIMGYAERDGNFMTNFFWHQPALNYGWGDPDLTQSWQLPINHPDVLALREEMKKIMKFWLNEGCSGFRVDMAGSLVKNDPKQSIRFFWQDIRKMLDEQYPDAFLISEWSNPHNAIVAGFHADFMHWFDGYDDLFAHSNSYFRKGGIGNICHFLDVYLKQYAFTKSRGYISLPVGNHDLIRINNAERDQKDLEIIQVFAFTMPNIPFVYYGDEIGMRQLNTKTGKEGAYGARAGDRSPMQWNERKNHGFSNASLKKLYLPIDTTINSPTVSSQQEDSNSLLNFTRKLINLHKTEPALANYSSFIPIYAQKNKYPFVFMRTAKGEKIVIVLNPSSTEQTAIINGELNGLRTLLLGSNTQWTASNNQTQITIKPRSFAIIKIK